MTDLQRALTWFPCLVLAGLLLGCNGASPPTTVAPSGGAPTISSVQPVVPGNTPQSGPGTPATTARSPATEEEEFDADSGPFTAGKKVFVANGCFRCHTINRVRGPVGGGAVGGRPVGSSGPGGSGMGTFLAKPLVEALDTDKDGMVTKEQLIAGAKKFFADCDKDKTGKLDEKALGDGLAAILPRTSGNPSTPGPGGSLVVPGSPELRPGGPGGFGPSTFLAGAIVKRADADKDGKVTLDELVAATEAFFQECDKDKKGWLEEKGLAAGINLLVPQPPAPSPDSPAISGRPMNPGGPGGPPGPGGMMPGRGPDLGKVAQNPEHTVDWLMRYVRNPKSVKPEARMPAFEKRIMEDDLRALAEYLASLK